MIATAVRNIRSDGGIRLPEQPHDAEREGDVGRRRDRPAAQRVGIAADDEDVDRGGNDHPGDRCGARQDAARPAAQRADAQLALDLEPDEQEEYRHQPVVDPVDHRQRPTSGMWRSAA